VKLQISPYDIDHSGSFTNDKQNITHNYLCNEKDNLRLKWALVLVFEAIGNRKR